MNIIFLDIDGVLNSMTSHYFNHSYPNENVSEYILNLSPNKDKMKIHNIKHLCLYSCTNLAQILLEVPNTKIVVSSTWRKRLSVDELNLLLHTMGVTKTHNCIYCNGVGHYYNYSGGQEGSVRLRNCRRTITGLFL